MERRLYT